MPAVVNTDAGAQFVDATDATNSTILIEEVDDPTFGRCGWTVLRGMTDQ